MDKINSTSCFNQFISQVKQAKRSGSKDIIIPMRMADELIMELSLILYEKVNTKSDVQINLGEITIDGGSFKR